MFEFGVEGQPRGSGKIYCFSDVKAKVEPLVVGRRKGNNELTGSLNLPGKPTSECWLMDCIFLAHMDLPGWSCAEDTHDIEETHLGADFWRTSRL